MCLLFLVHLARQVGDLFSHLGVLLLEELHFELAPLLVLLLLFVLGFALVLQLDELLERGLGLLLKELLLFHLFSEKVLRPQHLLDVLLVCVVRVQLQFVDVLQLCLFLLQQHVSLVQRQVFVFEFFNLFSRLRVLLDLEHELYFEICAEFTLLFESLL